MNKQDLEKKIIEASRKYYTDGSSTISDSEFDELVKELTSIDPQNPILTAVGWGWKVGEKGAKHPYLQITGIDNKPTVEPETVINNGEATYGPKLDGSSVVCYYKNGIFYQAITRGDGDYGMDITHNVVDKVPIIITHLNLTGYIRCEAVISFESFDKHFPITDNIRNKATGIIGAQEKKPLLPYVDLVPISIYDADKNKLHQGGSPEYLSYASLFSNSILFLCKYEGEKGNIEISNKTIDIMSDYPCDGIVCYKDDEIYAAYKFNTDYAEATIKYIEGKTQSTGRIFPRIHIEEVQMKSCKVNKISGKSGELIINSKLGKGAIIEIVRSGEVIPNFTGVVIKESEEVWVPKCSYGCDKSFVKRDGANFFCTEPKCPSIYEGTIYNLIMRFAPKRFTEEMLLLIKAELTFDFEDNESQTMLMDLLESISEGILHVPCNTEHQKDLISQTFENLKIKKMSIYDLVSVCSIDGFGNRLSTQFEKTLGSDVNKILMEKKVLTVEECNNSKARESWKNRHYLIQMILDVFEIVLPEVEKEVKVKGTVCITGSLSSCTKKDFNGVIESKGYKQVSGVTKALTILICNKEGSSKAKKAEKYGVVVVSEQEFIDCY